LSVAAVATETRAPTLDAEAAAGRSPMRLFEPSGSTLEDVILGAWEDLAAGGPCECPVCHGRLRVAGGCEGCGSELS
jgi:hypothetical protein